MERAAAGRDASSDREAEITWLCRETYHNEMTRRAKEALAFYPSNEMFKLLLAVGDALIGKVQESVDLASEFTAETTTRSESSLLAALLIQSTALRIAGTTDRTILSRIESRVREERKGATAIALARAATVLFLLGKYDRAGEYIDRACKIEQPCDESVSTIGVWINLHEAKTTRTSKNEAKKCMETAWELALRSTVVDPPPNVRLDLSLAMAKCHEANARHDRAIALLSSLVVKYPKSCLPLVEKMHNQLAGGEWDEALNSAERILSIDQNSIDAIRGRAIVALCRDGHPPTALKHVQAFFRNSTIAEPDNMRLMIDSLQLFSRISSRDTNIIAQLSRVAEKFIRQTAADERTEAGDVEGNEFLSSGKRRRATAATVQLMVELGNIYLLAGRIIDAERAYRDAVRIDESSFAALAGLANCQIADQSSAGPNSINLARQQMDFLTELATTEINCRDNALVGLMSAKIRVNQPKEALDYLERTVATILDALPPSPPSPSPSSSPPSTDDDPPIVVVVPPYPGYHRYLIQLDPLLCLDIVDEYLIHCPASYRPRSFLESRNGRFDDGQLLAPPPPHSDHHRKASDLCSLLERVVQACPGMARALVLLGKVRAQMGHPEEALLALGKLLDSRDPSNSAVGHLLVAQIHAHRARYDLAAQSLELGLSSDFRVRDDPIYHLVSSMIERHEGRTEARVASLERAMKLLDEKYLAPPVLAAPISTCDRVTLHIEMIEASASLGRFDRANSLMELARDAFGHSLEGSRLVIADAELRLDMDQVDEAIDRLAGIQPGDPYYLEARTKLATIHLERRKDRRSFAKCFRDLVQHCPGPRTYSMLGDAYIAIQEPERAIEAYEESLSENPHDRILAEKMGKALVKTHQYGRAIAYYREIVRNKACADLKLDLAELYTRVKQFDKAESLLVQELQDSRAGDNDLQSLERRGINLTLLAKIREKAGNVQSALATLREARDNQKRCLQRASSSGTAIAGHKQTLATICLDMADYATSLRDYDEAIERYKEALSHKPADIKALLSLAKLYMQVNDLDRCGQSCMALLNADPENEAASVMMADLAFRKVDFETAAYHFRQLLLVRPSYWTALARLIEVSRRTGNTSDLDEWLKRAAAATENSSREGGYYYCSGLLDWRTGKLNSALRNLNCARRDPEWGQQAIYNMIEICLDPDDDSALSSEAFDDNDDDDAATAEYHDSRSMALKTAQRLLLELSPKGNAQETLTHRLLGNFFLLATKQKANIERALQDCTSLASQEALRDHVGPALGLAMAHILMKQTPRARNHLKRVSKNVWTFEDAEYLERCWLLLADIYVQSGKYELASELLKRVLRHNATCVRAHELSGHIAEREQNYREAAIRYAQAWKYGGKMKLSLGYKLAYSFSKCKSYPDAIRVCNEVLRQNPDFPRIKKDILEKSINNIRS